MFSIAIRGLFERKMRSALTALAVLLGVAMIAGTLMLTASVNRSFDDIFAEVNAGTDVSVRPELAVDTGFDAPPPSTALDQSLLKPISKVDGVKQAVGSIADAVALAILNDKGERIGPPQGGPPHLALSVDPEPFNPFTYVEGRAPESPGEVAIDTITSDEESYEIGERITIAGSSKAQKFELVGIARFGAGVPLGGASLAVFTLDQAQELTGKQGKFDEISVEAEDGVSDQELSAKIQKILPRGVLARTGDETAEQDANDVQEGFGFLSTALLVFAAISLFVSAFLIYNTFSITVAQRTREFALLRTIGASARQIRRAVLIEAAFIGLIAAVLGVFGGIGFVAMITGLFKAMGFDLPTSGLTIPASSVIAALVVGVGATVISSLMPAIRATRITPLEGLHADLTTPESDPSRRRGIFGSLLAIGGIVVILLGLFTTETIGSAMSLLGLGLVLVFFSVVALGERLIRPLASAIGRPIERLRGVTGRLARENTLRNPSRTSTTATALMIGLALVVFVAVFAQSLRTSFDKIIEQQFAGDLAVLNIDGFSPISSQIPAELEKIDGVKVVSPFALVNTKIKDVGNGLINGVEPKAVAQAVNFDWEDGSDELIAGIGKRDLIAEAEWASDNNVEVGDTLTLTAPNDSRYDFTVVGTANDRPGLVFSPIAIRRDITQRLFDATSDQFTIVVLESGVDFDATRKLVDRSLKRDYPNAETRSQQQLRDDQAEDINGLLTLIYALLALSVIVSMFGVVNTLMLTIHERTRELGMLRAIGTSRSQVRRMIRYESVITAMIGAVIGAVIGLGVGAAAVTALEGEGLTLSIPWGLIGITFIVAGFAGVFAAIFPARRASRLDVIEALQYE